MSSLKQEKISEGLLAVQIDSKSSDFHDFKQFLKSKVDSLSIDQRNIIELQSSRIEMLEYLESDVKKKELVEAGKFLKEILKKLNIKQNKFSEYLGIKPSNLSKLLNGDRSIGIELSIILEEIFGIESNLWTRVQMKNKLLKISKRELQSYKKFKLRDLTKLNKKNAG